jgi:hypothetical protein
MAQLSIPAVPLSSFRRILAGLTLGALLLAPAARANDGEFYGAGATVYPVKNQAISMDTETLVIEQRGPLRTYVDHWLVSVRYEFVNTTQAPVAVQMGFPEHCQRLVGDESEGPSCKKPAMAEFSVRIDGQPAKVTVKATKKGERGALPDAQFDRVHTFEVRFTPGERKVVEHTYTHRGRIVSPMHSGVDYILRTGGLWKGPIREFDMRLVLKSRWKDILSDGPEDRRLPAATTQGWAGGTYQMRWQLKNFLPKADLELLLQEPLVVEARQALNEAMDKAAEDPKFLRSKSPAELQQLRNLPAALLGYAFKDEALRKSFESQPWYAARTDYAPQWLSAAEQKFMAAVKAAEAEAK